MGEARCLPVGAACGFCPCRDRLAWFFGLQVEVGSAEVIDRLELLYVYEARKKKHVGARGGD